MFGFGKVRCRKRWCRRSFTRSYRGFINSEILGWYHQRLGVSWCREHNPMKGNDVTFMQKPEGDDPEEEIVAWLKGKMKLAMDEAWRENVEVPLLGDYNMDIEPQGIIPMPGAFRPGESKEFRCLLCTVGDHGLLVGNPECVCCPTHYTKTLNDL